jgi:hypothetical protein
MNNYATAYGSLVTGAFPNIAAKNSSTPTSRDGTPYDRRLVDDIWGFFQDLLSRAGLTPTGISEAAGASQIVEALHYAVQGPGITVLSNLNSLALAKRRLMPLQGQVIEIALYAELCAAVYVGDGDNATATAFYKTSDSGGTTRTTAGTYMVMPDARGLVPRGIGYNSKIFAANGGSYTGGSLPGQLLGDLLQGFRIPTGTAGAGSYAAPGSASSALVAPAGDGANGVPRLGFETRGASIGEQICISY